MKFDHTMSLGGWSCPVCGEYSSHGAWLYRHLIHSHRMPCFDAWAVMGNMCTVGLPLVVRAPMVAPVAIPAVSFRLWSDVEQMDLFNGRKSLISR